MERWSATPVIQSPSATVAGCSPFTLPADAILSFANGEQVALNAGAIFQPACSESVLGRSLFTNSGISIDDSTSSSTDTITNSSLRDPFYSSTFPQCYALAATTILSYTLVIMLFIAPRSFLDGGVVVLGRRGFTNGPASGISIGGRPWLQKVAALTVAISLTIATADTFRLAEQQYSNGDDNAKSLQNSVLGGIELEVVQLISDTFLWLAQAQTLIRLFPRQREKIIIKWTAFSLITLDVIFGGLNSFLYSRNTKPATFTDAIPALSYLFQLSLGVLYAAWVIYYSLMKKRYAYFHPLMKNICLVAMLSILSILVPIVFFILDISQPDLTGWGDYVRWVGAAAASVLVWEWVERIEALEREEKKDGILGREVFDGDEMIDVSGSDLMRSGRRRSKKKLVDDDGEAGLDRPPQNATSDGGLRRMWPAMSSITTRYIPNSVTGANRGPTEPDNAPSAASRAAARFLPPPLWISRPPPAVTPISRTETASADSTVYAVRYQPLTDSTSRTTEDRQDRPFSRGNSRLSFESGNQPSGTPPPNDAATEPALPSKKQVTTTGWRQVLGIRQVKTGPPVEVLPHTQKIQPPPPRREYDSSIGWWDVRGRIEDFAVTQAERIREKMRPTPDTESLEVMVIPAPPRRGAALARLLEEEQTEAQPTPQVDTVIPAPSPLDLPPLVVRNTSTASSSSRSTPSSIHRIDNPQPGPSRYQNATSPTGSTPGHNTGFASVVTSTSPRRPVDDILRDGPRSPQL
ncbi:PalH/RIM21-domain-containing protein [Xylariales sp. PMI_506]|nr:PalH/RIM21-domain-containing protein [Xylariales sp. PMI_506]